MNLLGSLEPNLIGDLQPTPGDGRRRNGAMPGRGRTLDRVDALDIG
jgi:hypothetical protein